MAGLAVLFYLYQVGIIRKILQCFGAVRADQPAGAEAGVAGVAGVAGGVNGNVGAAQDAVALVPPVPEVPRGNIPHATTGGFLTDVVTFFMGFFLSLMPAWQPIAQPPIQPDVAIPAVGDMPDANLPQPPGPGVVPLR